MNNKIYMVIIAKSSIQTPDGVKANLVRVEKYKVN